MSSHPLKVAYKKFFLCIIFTSYQNQQTYHLEKCEICVRNIVKVNLRVKPYGVISGNASFVVGHIWRVQFLASCPINALVKLSHKQLYAHDGKNEPEDETDKQHIENGWDGLY